MASPQGLIVPGVPSIGRYKGKLWVPGVSAPSLPSGPLAVFDPSTFNSGAGLIPNTAVSPAPPASQNLLRAPRSWFSGSFGLYGPHSNLTVTDNSVAAPDGSSTASTITSAVTSWFLQANSQRLGTKLTSGQQYTLAISIKSLSGSNIPFKFGPTGNGGSEQSFTATTVWQRFTVTFTATSTAVITFLIQGDGTTAANFAICDLELFKGAADLNTAPLSAFPQVMQNGDIQVGFDATSSVSGGKLISGSAAILQLENAIDVTNYTIIYVANNNKTYTPQDQYAPVIACAEPPSSGWSNFAVGPVIQSNWGQYIANNHVDGVWDGDGAVNSQIAVTSYGELAGEPNTGPVIIAHSFGSGATAKSFINGVKVSNFPRSSALTPAAFRNMFVGCLANSFFSTFDLYYVAIYARVLTDAEIQAATAFLASKITTMPYRTALFLGSSITSGLGGIGYVFQLNESTPVLSPKLTGADWGFAGNSLSAVLSQESMIYAAFENAPAQEKIIHMDCGVNDLNQDPSTLAANFTTPYAALCDRLRAAGFKVVLVTTMSRTDAAGTANYLANRATINPIIRSWVGTHCDAVADWASDPNMGTDTAPNNTTYFADTVHPTTLGHKIIAGYSAAAINSV